jgi:hypothetical protein
LKGHRTNRTCRYFCTNWIDSLVSSALRFTINSSKTTLPALSTSITSSILLASPSFLQTSKAWSQPKKVSRISSEWMSQRAGFWRSGCFGLPVGVGHREVWHSVLYAVWVPSPPDAGCVMGLSYGTCTRLSPFLSEMMYRSPAGSRRKHRGHWLDARCLVCFKHC